MVLEYSDGAKDKFLLISEPLRKCSGLKIDDDLEEDVSQIKLRARRKLTVAIGATSLFTVGYLLSVIGSVNTM